MQKLKKKGLNEVWWEMREVSRDCNHPEHFSNNQFLLGFFNSIDFFFTWALGRCPSCPCLGSNLHENAMVVKERKKKNFGKVVC